MKLFGALLLMLSTPAFAAVRLIQTYAIPASSGSLFADVNGDGYDDLIMQDRVVLGGAGASRTAVGYEPLTGNDRLYGTADFNGDGRADVLVQQCPDGVSASLTARLLRGGADGTLTEAMRFDAPQATPSLADVNGDGHMDVVYNSMLFVDGTPPSLAIYRNDNGALVRELDLATQRPFGITEIAAGDLDGDARPEMVLVQGYWLATFSRRDDGTWSEGRYRFLPDLARYLAVRDVDGDGANDVVFSSVMNGSSLINVLFNDGSGHFRETAAVSAGTFDDSPANLRQEVRSLAFGEKLIAAALSDGTVEVFTVRGRTLRELTRTYTRLSDVTVAAARLTNKDGELLVSGFDANSGLHVTRAYAFDGEEVPAATSRRRAASAPRADLSGDYIATFDCNGDSFSTVWSFTQEGLFLDATAERSDESLDAVALNGAIEVRFLSPRMPLQLFSQLRPSAEGGWSAATGCGTVSLRAR
ncbi:MAG TPA: VCBS repeat-containing protein [Thermoanaerobaculia bacterium]|nr:VCBS repeat-containing protein [Thermoanaerobaculia bacterium]